MEEERVAWSYRSMPGSTFDCIPLIGCMLSGLQMNAIEIFLRGLPSMTSENFMFFSTTPLSAVTEQTYIIKFTQPLLLHLLFHDCQPPSSADVLYGSPLMQFWASLSLDWAISARSLVCYSINTLQLSNGVGNYSIGWCVIASAIRYLLFHSSNALCYQLKWEIPS